MNLRQANFPFNEETAIAMLYLEKQNINGMSPAEVVDRYFEILKEVKQAINEKQYY